MIAAAAGTVRYFDNSLEQLLLSVSGDVMNATAVAVAAGCY